MRSLRALSAEALASHPQVAPSLAGVAHSLYPLLFKASYLLERAELVRLLLERWPLEEFLLSALLGPSADHPQDLRDRACRVCLQACAQGLADHVLRPGGGRLRVADLTGLRDVQEQRCPCGRALGRWGRTELLARTCCGLQGGGPTAGRPLKVLADLFVTEGNLEVAVRALEGGGPLRLHCLSFRADSLDPGQLLHVLRLAGPSQLRRLTVVHSVRLHAGLVQQLLALGFPQLVSLTLPTKAFDMTPAYNPGPDSQDALLTSIAGELSRMTQLAELSVAFSTLTGKVQRLLGPLRTPLRVLDLANCSLSHADLAFLADSMHAAHLEELDLSGHPLVNLYPSTFFRLLGRAAATLRTLTLEECGLEDGHVGLLSVALGPCQQLQELRLLGNPLSARALRHLLATLCTLPQLRGVQVPVPSDCYPAGVPYPQDELTQSKFDQQKYEAIAAELQADLLRAGRADVQVSTPLHGSFDPDLQETGSELGARLLQAFRAALENLSRALRQME
ncbi:leucine-rich repeat-containing protein 14B [Talpa occidentalis]|uniref:leucine-rich repeat-containing protein 14B n=1 Tax=Talpa occidentalis TaxID=50954 RepID=UPI0018903A0E|nr:leucine-rich repeat-containing protein 14B [Talpa occidentalis]